jgi:hypothetical protein
MPKNSNYSSDDSDISTEDLLKEIQDATKKTGKPVTTSPKTDAPTSGTLRSIFQKRRKAMADALQED